DIREQFPLLPQSRTEEIAEKLGIKHPHFDGVPVVMTTDFVITLKTPNGLIDIVRTIKPANKLTTRTLELFEIERRFFSEQGISWGIITEEKLPKTLINNVKWMCEAKYLDTRPGIDEELVDLVSDWLFENIYTDDADTSISKICLRSDRDFGREGGRCMFILQYMRGSKTWLTNMKIQINESQPSRISRLEDHTKINKDIG